MNKPKLGTGKRFNQLESTLKVNGATTPAALAAYIGRKKYGPKKFSNISHYHNTRGKM